MTNGIPPHITAADYLLSAARYYLLMLDEPHRSPEERVKISEDAAAAIRRAGELLRPC